MKKATKRKRLVLGRDFDAWAFVHWGKGFKGFAFPGVPSPSPIWKDGKWVRVKFTKVEP